MTVVMCTQALMLPEAVRLLHLLVSSGKRVYVHCTAGINRATLTTVGYLTFVKVRCSRLSSILHRSSSQALAQLHLSLSGKTHVLAKRCKQIMCHLTLLM